MKTKICISCNNKQHYTEFVWTPSSVDNRSAICRRCKSYMDGVDSIAKIINHKS